MGGHGRSVKRSWEVSGRSGNNPKLSGNGPSWSGNGPRNGPISIVQSFFCVLFFSLCSNLSIWPVRQVVPDEPRCYIPIFDGLVDIVVTSMREVSRIKERS